MLEILNMSSMKLRIPNGGRIRVQVCLDGASHLRGGVGWLDLIDVANLLVDDEGRDMTATDKLVDVKFEVREVEL